jgi:hypothetical protein
MLIAAAVAAVAGNKCITNDLDGRFSIEFDGA